MELWDVLDENRVKTGRLAQRGIPLGINEYHLVVHAVIINKKKQFLISKRTPNKSYPNCWEFTGGSVLAGEESLEGVLREVKEELGIQLDSSQGRRITTRRSNENGKSMFVDVWLFEKEVDCKDILFQPEETCDAKWVDRKTIEMMMEADEFVPAKFVFYLPELFQLCGCENDELHS